MRNPAKRAMWPVSASSSRHSTYPVQARSAPGRDSPTWSSGRRLRAVKLRTQEGTDERALNRIPGFGLERASTVRHLRLWCHGPDSQCDVWNDFASLLGPARGRVALRSFEHLIGIWTCHSPHPLACRPLECNCLGADEIQLTRLIDTASLGDREGALNTARRMVGDGPSVRLASLAESVGVSLRTMAERVRPGGHASNGCSTALN